jgi:hypothetical protein
MKVFTTLAFALSLTMFGTGCADEADGGGDAECTAVTCIETPGPVCQGDTRETYQAIGTCRVVEGETVCTYTVASQINCNDSGRFCQNGQCVETSANACDGVTCVTAPAPGCDGNTAQIYEPNGTCDPTIPPRGECVHPVDSELDCEANDRVCRDGGCIDPNAFPCDPNPCDVPPAGTCAGKTPQTPPVLGTCIESSGVANCQFTAAPGTACTTLCVAGACATATIAVANAGDLVINEIMRNPFGDDDFGEWVELFNPRATAGLLDGCTLADDGGDSYTIPAGANLIVPAGGYLVLGRSNDFNINGGFTPDHVYTGYVLANSADEVVLRCGETNVEIDRVTYLADGWPFMAASSMSLRPGSDHTTNDTATNWCDATQTFGRKVNRGTPRKANPVCP